MTDEIELISDDDGLVVLGDRVAVEQFLDSVGQLSASRDFRLDRLRRVLDAGAEVAHTMSDIAENSARYLKLTDESMRLRREFGLMETKTPGISHAMLGRPGSISGWLQAETGPGPLLTNPAVLEGIGGLMTQLARQAEAAELKALLVKIDEKLDDVRRAQRDRVLAKMDRATLAIEEAMAIRDHGGNRETAWGKVEAESGTIFEVQGNAVRSLVALADKVDSKNKVGTLAKTTRDVKCEARVWLAVLAHCFRLQDELAVLEIDHVLDVAPADLDGHRRGLARAQKERRELIVGTTERLIDRMEQAGVFADSNVLLHKRGARSVVHSFNSTAAIVEEFYAPLGIDSSRGSMEATRWRDALHDPEQLGNAGAEARRNAPTGVAILGTAVALGKVVVKRLRA